MCGICVVIKLVECKFTAENKERCENECGAAEESVRKLLFSYTKFEGDFVIE